MFGGICMVLLGCCLHVIPVISSWKWVEVENGNEQYDSVYFLDQISYISCLWEHVKLLRLTWKFHQVHILILEVWFKSVQLGIQFIYSSAIHITFFYKQCVEVYESVWKWFKPINYRHKHVRSMILCQTDRLVREQNEAALKSAAVYLSNMYLSTTMDPLVSELGNRDNLLEEHFWSRNGLNIYPAGQPLYHFSRINWLFGHIGHSGLIRSYWASQEL